MMVSAKLNYSLIFKLFFMKKLIIVLGCFVVVTISSSCTADSPIETKNENLITPAKIPVPVTNIVADDDKEDPLPPKK
jgi:hypothetical protein